ncbi:MAG: alpha/beta hydrolase [Oscillospiraceae bacterium]|jgi:alpha-beta hydrolase superfamily lysophospholipase|nr:alpha/beta hydrolase [Oscillospiraceae bacterium]
MDMTRREGVFPSSSGIADIYYRVWEPADGRITAAVQLIHGMAEHGERYEGFARALCGAGYSVWMMDLLGHGKSSTEEGLGFFGWRGENGGRHRAGWTHFYRDAKKLTTLMQEALPPGTPLFLFGHSMGSFVARAYVEKFGGDYAGACFCGTSGPNPAAAAGVLAARLVIALRGERHRSRLIDSIAFGHYNDKYPGKARTKFDWLNTDPSEVDRYIADPRCGFLFTAAGYLDLMRLMRFVSRPAWFGSMPHRFPMLLIAGAADPVGAFGKGVELVARRLRGKGKKQTTCHIFPGMRHEILLEPERREVYEAVLGWLGKIQAQI